MNEVMSTTGAKVEDLYTRSVFEKLDRRGVVYAVTRSYLLGQRVYCIVTAKTSHRKLKGLFFNPRVDSDILELEMTPDDIDVFNSIRVKNFTMKKTCDDGAIYELKERSFKKYIRNIEKSAQTLILAIEDIVESGNSEKSIKSAERLIKTLIK